MELRAPTEALRYLHDKYGALDALVFSDSEYVVLGITDRTRARRKNLDYWARLEEAVALHHYVEFEHVKGHADNRFNIQVDKLAGEARRAGVSALAHELPLRIEPKSRVV
jgi:ribonuclease HI